MKFTHTKRWVAGILAVLTVGVLAGCSKAGSSADSTSTRKQTTIRIGVVGENNEQWTPVIDQLAQDGVTLELVKFADYTLPNQALVDGEIDLNAFQHYAFLNHEIEEKNLALTAIGETIIAPLGLYSHEIKSVDELKTGDSIAIPSDATNGGRSLKLLESASLIKVDPSVGYTPEVSDITDNPLELNFIQMEAAQIPSLLPDVAAGIINGGHAVDNGFNPTTDSIVLETVQEGEDNPYINVIVARSEDENCKLYQNIVRFFQSDDVATVIENTYHGAYQPAWK